MHPFPFLQCNPTQKLSPYISMTFLPFISPLSHNATHPSQLTSTLHTMHCSLATPPPFSQWISPALCLHDSLTPLHSASLPGHISPHKSSNNSVLPVHTSHHPALVPGPKSLSCCHYHLLHSISIKQCPLHCLLLDHIIKQFFCLCIAEPGGDIMLSSAVC